jgi:hypothetical protein
MDIRYFEYAHNFFPIVKASSYQLKALGKGIRKKIHPSGIDKLTQQDILRNIRRMHSTGTRTMTIFPHNLPPFIFTSLLNDLPTELTLVSVHNYDNPLSLGVINIESLPPLTSPSTNPLSLAAAHTALLTSLTHDFQLIHPTLSSLQHDLLAAIYPLLFTKLSSRFLINTIFDYVGTSGSSHRTKSAWLWIFNYCVLQIKLPPNVHSFLHDPKFLKEINDADFTHLGNRSHALQSYNSGKTYFWPKVPPFLSQPFGPKMFHFTNTLMYKYHWLHNTKDCFFTRYAQGGQFLNYHADIFNNRAELVTLFFSGEIRQLSFKQKEKSNEIAVLTCTSSHAIVLTPLSNEIFLHSKIPNKSTNSSTSLAFRAAMPLIEACTLHNHIRKHLGINSSTLQLLSKLKLS